MQNNKDVVQEALVQIKNVEQALAENAKGILQSTMKEEIGQLVKESLSEQDDEEIEIDAEMDAEPSDDLDLDVSDEMDADNEEEMDMGLDVDMDMDSDEESPIDLTHASDEEILKVFKAMGEEDGIIIKKDGNDIHLKDNNEDVEYLVKLGESIKRKNRIMEMDEIDNMDDSETQKVIDAIFANESYSDLEEEEEEEEEEVMYEIEFNESDDMEEEMDESDDMEEEMDESDEMEEGVMYEIEFDESDDMDEEYHESLDESYSHKKSKTMVSKPKGVKGHGPKFSYKKSTGGFNEDKKEGPKSVGTGSVKKAKSFPKGENTNGKPKMVKKSETKEAARTYAFGSKEGRGLRKGVTPNRNFVYGKNGVKKESVDNEVETLREKNEEYRKALNVFREKLNEVAIFNSNLAYATRLFTEHSTTKKEKINILRRFDNVESLKESKALYKSMKEELSKSETKSINESVEKKLNKTVSSGSSTTLIESKTYEAPQFLRIKDLMSKLG